MPRGRGSNRPTLIEIGKARSALRRLIDRACIARGEAQWTNGYRAGQYANSLDPEGEDQRLYVKERAQFEQCGKVERACERSIAKLERLVRLAK